MDSKCHQWPRPEIVLLSCSPAALAMGMLSSREAFFTAIFNDFLTDEFHRVFTHKCQGICFV